MVSPNRVTTILELFFGSLEGERLLFLLLWLSLVEEFSISSLLIFSWRRSFSMFSLLFSAWVTAPFDWILTYPCCYCRLEAGLYLDLFLEVFLSSFFLSLWTLVGGFFPFSCLEVGVSAREAYDLDCYLFPFLCESIWLTFWLIWSIWSANLLMSYFPFFLFFFFSVVVRDFSSSFSSFLMYWWSCSLSRIIL